MMKWVVTGILVASILACAGAAGAAGWTLVGTPGFTVASPSATMQDYDRIKFNSIAFDSAGRMYVTANNGNNNGAAGGITIFQANGTKIADVNVNALGYPGAVTKLVTGGDGVVYGVQNYTEISWGANATNVNRILAFSPTGGVTRIWDTTMVSSGQAASADWIQGFTVGGDGNLYWTMNGNNAYWKAHWLWYYDVAASATHEALSAGTNLGGLDSSRCFNLEFLGTSSDSYSFGAVKSGGTSWRLDKVSYTASDYTARVLGSDETPGNVDWVTSLAFDSAAKNLWVGSRGGGGTSGWANKNGCQLAKVVIDPATDNRGLQAQASAASGYYRMDLKDSYKISCAATFKVDSNSTDFNRGVVELCPQQPDGKSPQVILHRNATTNKFAVQITSTDTDIAPFNNNWHTVHVAIDCTDVNTSGNKKVRVWFDGTKVIDTYSTGIDRKTGGWCCFGNSVKDSFYTGSCTVTFDQVSVNKDDAIDPGGAWTKLLGYDMDCRQYPERIGTSSNMGYWHSNSSDGFFPNDWLVAWAVNGNTPTISQVDNGGRYWVQTMAVNPANHEAWMSWNGEDTYNYDPIGTVWVRKQMTNAVSGLGYEGVPEAGAQTVALAFRSGKVYATTCNMTTGVYHVYSKVPTATSMTVNQAKQAYPGTYVSTNATKLVTFPDIYVAVAGALKYFYIEDADRSSAIKVLWDPGSESIVPVVGQKVSVTGRTGVQNGEAVIFADSVVATDTTDSVKPLAMQIKSIGGNKMGIQPTVLLGNSTDYGWSAYSINTTGLLIKASGKLRIVGGKYYLDDSSPYPIRIDGGDFISIPGSDGTNMVVTGISGVYWDGANGFRTIMPRTGDDIKTY